MARRIYGHLTITPILLPQCWKHTIPFTGNKRLNPIQTWFAKVGVEKPVKSPYLNPTGSQSAQQAFSPDISA